MNANRFYSVPFDARNDTAMKKLRRKNGGLLAFGRWQALLGILYDEDGAMDFSDEDNVVLLMEELEFTTEEELRGFLSACASCKLISLSAWECRNMVVSEGVGKELDYRAQKSEAGKKSGAARREKSKQKG